MKITTYFLVLILFYSQISSATTVCESALFRYSMSDSNGILEIQSLETGRKLSFSTQDHGESGEVSTVLSFISYGNGDSDWNLNLRFGGYLKLSFEHENVFSGEMELHMNKNIFPYINHSVYWSDKFHIPSSNCY